MDSLTPDPNKRGYLLPTGCKDLIDVLKLGESGDSASAESADPLNYKLQKGEAWGGLDEIERYASMVFEPSTLFFTIWITSPDAHLTIDVFRKPGGIISAKVEVQPNTYREAALREFLSMHHLPVPMHIPIHKGFSPKLPVYRNYDLMPVPQDAAHLAQLVTNLFRDVCDLTEHSSLIFCCNPPSQAAEGQS